MVSDVAKRIFAKCLSLLEQRLSIKIRNAVLIVDSDYGQFSLELNERKIEENLLLTSKFFHEKLVKTISRSRVGSSIVPCDICLGTGETVMSNLLQTCSKCKGGGEVVQILNKEFTGQNDLLESNGEQIQIHR